MKQKYSIDGLESKEAIVGFVVGAMKSNGYEQYQINMYFDVCFGEPDDVFMEESREIIKAINNN